MSRDEQSERLSHLHFRSRGLGMGEKSSDHVTSTRSKQAERIFLQQRVVNSIQFLSEMRLEGIAAQTISQARYMLGCVVFVFRIVM